MMSSGGEDASNEHHVNDCLGKQKFNRQEFKLTGSRKVRFPTNITCKRAESIPRQMAGASVCNFSADINILNGINVPVFVICRNGFVMRVNPTIGDHERGCLTISRTTSAVHLDLLAQGVLKDSLSDYRKAKLPARAVRYAGPSGKFKATQKINPSHREDFHEVLVWTEEELGLDQAVYLHEVDLVVTFSEEVAGSTLHPHSPMGVNISEFRNLGVVPSEEMFFSCFVVDNHNEVGKLYSAINGIVMELPKRTDLSLANGVYLKHSKISGSLGSETIDRTYYTFDDARKLGVIHDTHQSALRKPATRLEQLDVRAKELDIEVKEKTLEEKLEAARANANNAKRDHAFKKRQLDLQEQNNNHTRNSNTRKEILDAVRTIAGVIGTLTTTYVAYKTFIHKTK